MPDGNRVDESRQWLDRQQWDGAVTAIIERFKRSGPMDIFQRPSPLDILFCWLQLGDPEDVRAFVQSAVERDDNQFVSALNAMRGWSSSSQGIRHPLRRQYVEQFLDANAAKSRLEKIANADDISSSLKLLAEEVLRDWTDDRH